MSDERKPDEIVPEDEQDLSPPEAADGNSELSADGAARPSEEVRGSEVPAEAVEGPRFSERAARPVQARETSSPRGGEGPFAWMVMGLCSLASLVGLILLFTSGTPVQSSAEGGSGQSFGLGSLLSKSGVAVVDIEGVIAFQSSGGGMMGGGSKGAARTVRLLQKLRKEDKVKGVVLRINSPGGTVAASQEIWQQVKQLVAEGKPVVVSMADVAASGGYYVAAPASYIFANGGTITGSIGVITSLMKYEPLVRKIGIDWEVHKSGALKDMGAGYRPTTPAEEEVFKSMISGAYEQFVDAVVDGRVIKEELDSGRKPVLKSRDEVKAVADGRVFMGKKALEVGLVDELGGYYDALAKAGKLCGLGPEPHVIETSPHGGLAKFMEMLEHQASTSLWGQLGLPRPDASPVLYQWRP